MPSICFLTATECPLYMAVRHLVGDRAFPVAAARTWNSLLQHVMSAPSIYVS